MNGGKNSSGQQDAVRTFLAAFDDDAVQAAYAIREYVSEQRSTARPAKEPTGPVLLSVRDVKKQYKVGRQKLDVLQGISLDIHEGEFVAITGASGGGKSTLLQLIGGLDKPTAGSIVYGDTELGKLSDGKLSEFRRQTIGFVFQFFYLQPFLGLQQNLEVPGMFAGTKRRLRHEQSRELAQKVGLESRLKHLPKELSGGQMQRAAIARALFNQPKILLADEPTGNLDSVNSDAIIALFETIRRELGTTIVIVTHDRSIARRADREIVIKDGVVV